MVYESNTSYINTVTITSRRFYDKFKKFLTNIVCKMQKISALDKLMVLKKEQAMQMKVARSSNRKIRHNHTHAQ